VGEKRALSGGGGRGGGGGAGGGGGGGGRGGGEGVGETFYVLEKGSGEGIILIEKRTHRGTVWNSFGLAP